MWIKDAFSKTDFLSGYPVGVRIRPGTEPG
jgi:hypothetical protein